MFCPRLNNSNYKIEVQYTNKGNYISLPIPHAILSGGLRKTAAEPTADGWVGVVAGQGGDGWVGGDFHGFSISFLLQVMPLTLPHQSRVRMNWFEMPKMIRQWSYQKSKNPRLN